MTEMAEGNQLGVTGGNTSTSSNNTSSYDHFTSQQQVILFSIGFFSITLSLFGSGTIIFLLIKTKKWKTQIQQRLVGGLSITDLILSTSLACMFFAAPEELDEFTARGNITTCNLAGFFFQFYLGGAFYNMALSFYYCLMITYGLKESTIQRWMEPWVHLIAFGIPIIIGTASLLTDMINPDAIHRVCTTEPYPSECMLHEDIPCERGSRDSPILPIAAYLYLGQVLTAIVLTIRVYLSVRNQTRQTLKYSASGELDPSQQRRIRAVGQQAVLYTAACLNGFVVVLLDTVVGAVFFSQIDSTHELKDKPGLFPVTIFLFLLFPLQGFWNFFIFIRPRLVQWKNANPDRSWFWTFRMFLTGKSPSTIRKLSDTITPSGASALDPSMTNQDDANLQKDATEIFDREQGEEKAGEHNVEEEDENSNVGREIPTLENGVEPDKESTY